jgi:hypothetical protein
MTKSTTLLFCAGQAWTGAGRAQFSAHILQPKAYSQQDNERIVKQFLGLRTSDKCLDAAESLVHLSQPVA